MIKKCVIFVLLATLMPVANALCFGNTHYSENYYFEVNCDIARIKDFTQRRTYDLSCSKGLVYFYYCIKN